MEMHCYVYITLISCIRNKKVYIYYNNDICECAYYLAGELKAKMKNRPGFFVVHISSRRLVANIDKEGIDSCLINMELFCSR